MAAGCDDFVRKPYREADIFRVMAEHLGLRYLYGKEEPQVSAAPETALHPRDLALLPADLRAALLQAVLELDTTRAQEVVETIERQDGVIGPVLRKLAENLEYERLLALLEDNDSEPEDI
ncbi:MAG: Response regulator receiver protein [uncultured bacterium]|nr:MAG: Response regulator receiver protein [uncultured bacterium]